MSIPGEEPYEGYFLKNALNCPIFYPKMGSVSYKELPIEVSARNGYEII